MYRGNLRKLWPCTLVLLILASVAASSCAPKDDIGRFIGRTMAELEAELGLPTVPPEDLGDGRVLAIFMDNKAKVEAAATRDTSLRRYGWRFVLRNGKAVHVAPINGVVGETNRQAEKSFKYVAALYVASKNIEGTERRVPIGSINGETYFVAASSPSCGANVQNIEVHREEVGGQVWARIQMRFDLDSVVSWTKFCEEADNKQVLLVINKQPICIGVLRHLVDIGALEVSVIESANVTAALAKMESEPTSQP